MVKEIGAIIGGTILGIILVLVFGLLFAWIGVWLWGIIAVGVFGLPALTFWQFYGLIILMRILFPVSTTTGKKEN